MKSILQITVVFFIITICYIFTAVPEINEGLISYWSFDENQGTRVGNEARLFPDIFGITGEGNVYNPQWLPGKSGSAMDFRSGKTAVSVNKIPELSCEKSLTVSVWINVSGQSGRGMIINHENSYRLFIDGEKGEHAGFQLSLDGKWAGNWIYTKTAISTGAWNHIACVYNGEKRIIYLNGKIDAEEDVSGNIDDGRNFLIGGAQIKTAGNRGYTREDAANYSVGEFFSGSIDELFIWNRALLPGEIQKVMNIDRAALKKNIGDSGKIFCYALRTVIMETETRPFTLAIFNGAENEITETIKTVISGSNAVTKNAVFPLKISSRKKSVVEIPGTGLIPGIYQLGVWNSSGKLAEISVYVMKKTPGPGEVKIQTNKIIDLDLTKNFSPEEFVSDGSSKTINSPIGSYREAGPAMHSRFAVRLKLGGTGPHLVRVTYPDDRERVCEIMTSSAHQYGKYACHAGYYTGRELPLSHAMQTFEFVMWPLDPDLALVFTSWKENCPAAGSRIEVFEINGRLPSSGVKTPSYRWIGEYWEDAQPLTLCYGGSSPEFRDFDQAITRLCDYYDWTGQNILMHPLVWYEGPIYNSLIEPRGGKGGFNFPTSGFTDIILRRFEERGFAFHALLNVHEWPSLRRTMNTDMEKIRRGDPTFNAISKDNEVFIKTYHHRSSLFNALHPAVQKVTADIVREITERYGDSPAFSGVGFHLTMAQLLMPGSMDVSYDDWTITEFEKDTSITVDAAKTDPDRFGKRYAWIMANAREKWISWRCGRIASYYSQIAEIIQARRRDLVFTVTFLEPPMALMDDQRDAWLKGASLRSLAREAGIDPVMLSKINGLVVQSCVSPSALRSREHFGNKGSWGKIPQTKESIDAINIMNFTEQHLEYRQKYDFGVFFYNRYFESDVGKVKPLKSSWYNNVGWRATAIMPSHEHWLEYFARWMAMTDPKFITIGGFTPGTTGHSAQMTKFSEVFRQLPAGNWNEMKDVHKDATVRYLSFNGKIFLYAVNKSCGKISVLIPFKKELFYISLGNSPELKTTGSTYTALLGPYELAGWVSK
ncbi:MAG: hypothetical protein A2096_00345 [Spirochaetes bacterium GWF1_41_5]|nr:MAG: hypothetical protein A2096_00345 [Spirochaetes bacterium GWF1_41_5]